MSSSKRATRQRHLTKMRYWASLIAKFEREAWDYTYLVPFSLRPAIARHMTTRKYNFERPAAK